MTSQTKSRTMRAVDNNGSLTLVVTQTDGDTMTREVYYLQPIASGWAFTKTDGARYHVSADLCTCRDNEYRGRVRPCKHRAAVRKLQSLGKLPNIHAEAK
jgi:hypothetical protein